MAHFQSYYDDLEVRRIDEHGNPIVQADEHGNLDRSADECANPVFPSSDPYGKLGVVPPATGHSVGAEHRKEHHTLGGMLHRSGSSSSSFSEDDGHGGRRKKGLKEKIKEKLRGHHDDVPSHAAANTTPGGNRPTGERREKKGIMDKIKEKLPGSHHHRH